MVRKAEAEHWKNKFANSDSVKSFWKLVADFQGKNTHTKIGTLIDANGNAVTNDYNKANLLNHHFATVGERMCAPKIDKGNQHIYRVTPTCPELEFSYEIYKEAFSKSIKPGKAAGMDKISPKYLNAIGPDSSGLYHVIKQSIAQRCFPTTWKIGKVSCLHKKGKSSDCHNYRPITLLSVASKVLERVILSQINNHIDSNNLMSNHQWGFRSGRSTESILLHIVEKWNKALDEGKIIGVLFIDFKKAFDSVPHGLLMKKLQAMGISGSLYSILEDYLRDRKQLTIVNGHKSNPEHVNYGVPQGSLLGPRLFSIDVNDLPEKVESANTEMFADDAIPSCIRDSLQDAFSNMYKIIEEVGIWSCLNGFSVHTDKGKTKVMFLSRKSFIGPLPNFTLYSISIQVLTTA
jgi:hypothetical protein